LKLLGWVLLLGTLMLSALGASGLVRLLSQCVQSAQPAMSEFGAILRGAGILIAAGLVPLLGWFFVVPLSIIISTGAGWYALRGRAPAKRQTAQQETPHIAPVMPHPVHPISGLNGAAAHNGVTHSGVAHSGVEVVS
jgi:hypothetical protein